MTTPRAATRRVLIAAGVIGLGALAPPALSVITTQWGGSTGPQPNDIAIDPQGNVYTANLSSAEPTKAGTITKISADGATTQVFASPPISSGGLASRPQYIAVDGAGNVYTVNNSNTCNLTKFLPTGQLDATFGTNGVGTISCQPGPIVLNPEGTVFGTTPNGGKLTEYPATGPWGGTSGSASWTVGSNPYGVVIDSAANLYTANKGSNTVTRIPAIGSAQVSWASTGAGTGPIALAFDSKGNLFTANSSSNSVSKITIAGPFAASTDVFGTTGTNPQDIGVDAAGNVYTANQGSNSVTRIPAGGGASAQYGGATGSEPVAIAVDSRGNVYTANKGSNTVTRIGSPAGPLTGSPTAFPSTAPGATGTLTVTVTNTAADLAAVPSAITASGTGVSVTGGTCAAGTSIAPGGTCTVALSWKPTAAGALSGASLTIAYPNGATASDSITLTGTATSAKRLSATITASTSRVASGKTLRVGIRTRNGGSTSAAKVVSCIRVPSNFAIVSAKGAKRSGRTLCFSVGTLAAGKTATRSITVGAASSATVKRFFTGTTKASGIAQSKATRKAVTITASGGNPLVTG